MVYQQEITLELNSNTAYVTVGAKQGDSYTREIIVHITADGIEWVIPSNATAQYRVRKPDGNAIWDIATIDRTTNTVIVSLTGQTLASAGRAYADVVLYNGSGSNAEILSTVSFIIIIMASPDINEEIVSSSEFGYIQEVVNDANTVITESEAWAVGTRSGVPVLGDSFTSEITSGGNFTYTIDSDTFRNFVGIFTDETLNWLLTYTGAEHGWMITYQDGTTDYIEPSDVGLTIVSGTVYSGNQITVTISDASLQWHNNSKYWSERTYSAQEAIENLDATAQKVDQTADPEVDKITVHDVSVTNQPSGWDVQVDDEIFRQSVGEIIGDYIFYCQSGIWMLNDLEVTLSDYGISGVSTSVQDGQFTIHYYQHKRFNFKIPQGETGDVNFMTFYVGTDLNEVDHMGNSTYGQIVMNRPTEVTTQQINFRVNATTGNLEVLMYPEVENSG